MRKWEQVYKSTRGKIVIPVGNNQEKVFYLDPAQWLALKAKSPLGTDYKVKLMLAGQGAGKTWTIPVWIAYQARKHHIEQVRKFGHNYDKEFLGIVGSVDRERVNNLLARRFLQIWGNSVNPWTDIGRLRGASSNAVSTVLEFSPQFCKGRVMFRYLRHAGRAQGFHFTALAIDEADLVSEGGIKIDDEDWRVIQDRAQMWNAPILLTTTPYRFGWVYELYRKGDKVFFNVYFKSKRTGEVITHDEWLERGAKLLAEVKSKKDRKIWEDWKRQWGRIWEARYVEGDPEILVVIYPNILNTHYWKGSKYGESHIAAYLRALKEPHGLEWFNLFQMAKWSTPRDIVFRDFLEKLGEYGVPRPDMEDKPLYVGVDFGHKEAKPGLVFVHYDETTRTFYVRGEFEEYEKIEDLAGRIVGTAVAWGAKIGGIFTDPTGFLRTGARGVGSQYFAFTSALAARGLDPVRYVRPVSLPRVDTFILLRDVAASGRLYINPICKALLNEMGHFKEVGIGDRSKAKNTHLLDALRYVVAGIEYVEQMQKILENPSEAPTSPEDYRVSPETPWNPITPPW